MLTKYLTCKTRLKYFDEEKIVARLDPREFAHVNIIVTEPGEETEVLATGRKIKLSHDRQYLVGEIANQLHAYEQLGYSPEELKEIIEERKRFKAVDAIAKEAWVASFKNGSHLYVMPARQNGKSLLDAYKTTRAIYDYLNNDVEVTKALGETIEIAKRCTGTPWTGECVAIENVIFNDPATIVFWKDGTKTVVKATNEDFDPEKGLAMAITKKALGNKGNYFDTIKKWTKKYKKKVDMADLNAGTVAARAANAMKKLSDALCP